MHCAWPRACLWLTCATARRYLHVMVCLPWLRTCKILMQACASLGLLQKVGPPSLRPQLVGSTSAPLLSTAMTIPAVQTLLRPTLHTMRVYPFILSDQQTLRAVVRPRPRACFVCGRFRSAPTYVARQSVVGSLSQWKPHFQPTNIFPTQNCVQAS